MKHYQNSEDKIWQDFLSRWGEQFKDMEHIFRYFRTYEQLFQGGRGRDLYVQENLERGQREWLVLLSRLEKSEDSDFLKEHWIPFEVSNYDYFIDLSNKDYPFIQVAYHPFLRPAWNTITIFPSINELLFSLEHGVAVYEIIAEIWDNQLQAILDKYSGEH